MRKVLIAHNPGLLTEAIASHLCSKHDVQVCHTGTDALTLIDRQHFDVLILYLSLPDMDGISILRRATYKPRRIIALTNVANDLVVQQAATVGIDDIILIPCRVSYICDRINAFCSLMK